MPDFTTEQTALKVLVADDLSSARRIICRLLNKLGFENVHEAEDGNEAFERAAAGDIDIMICDWLMPKMDGLQLMHKISAEAGCSSMAFLLITGNRAPEQLETVQEAVSGLHAQYMVKPFTMADLAGKLNILLNPR